VGQADPDIDTGIAQTQRVGVSLAAIPDDRDGTCLRDTQVGVIVVENVGWHQAPLSRYPN
jgi:hypothetical protein